MRFLHSHFGHHWRFYACLIFGAIVYALTSGLKPPVRTLAGGDAFFAAYLIFTAAIAARITPRELDKKADVEDEGIGIVLLICLVMIGFSSFSIITILNQKHGADPLMLALAIASAPLGWFTLHVLMAFHYAYLFYSEPGKKPGSGLEFPGAPEPGAGDFLYFSFVVGMTAQVSDVQVTSRRIRRSTLAHSIVSFFFNTVLIAMAVNAVVAIAS